MKTLITYFILLIGLFSCQQEENIVLPDIESISRQSSLYSLLKRVSQYPTEMDNFIDGTSCFSVAFPYSVIIDGMNVEILDESDFATVALLISQPTFGSNEIVFAFPISIIFKNHQILTIDSQQQFDQVLSSCEFDNSLSAIRCVDFNYPLTVRTYDSNLQVADSIIFFNDAQLYNFLNGIDSDFIFGFDFPLLLTTFDNEQIAAQNNAELANYLQNAVGDECTLTVN